MALSQRADGFAKPDPTFLLWDILQDLWHPESNPNGYVNLGVAENDLMHDKLAEHIHQNLALVSADFTYGDGKKRLKASLARFLTRKLNPVVPIDPSHITSTNGCSSAVEHSVWAFGNPGDVFLLGRPYYGMFGPDVEARMGTRLVTVDFGEFDPISAEGVSRYEAKILEVQAQGKKVAGLILAHPHNPLGRCYPRSTLVEIMKLCQKYQVHLISDEIYALSTFPNRIDKDVDIHPFESALSIDPTGIVDPALIHVLWGVSKDFGANGLRLGVIISQHNPKLHAALMPVYAYSSTSSMTDNAVSNFLDDDTWVDAYLVQSQRLLGESFEHVVDWACKNDIEYSPGVNAAFFLWVNLGKRYQKAHPTPEDQLDQVVMDALLRERVFLAAGAQFGSEKPGWFRIVFSQQPEYLDLGLDRIISATR